MKKIAYLLHRFPGLTDTFIKREICGLQKAGAAIQIISVWKPKQGETTPQILDEWSAQVVFLLPRPAIEILLTITRCVCFSPIRFLTAARLALSTARPGLRGLAYQAIYLIEAILAADAARCHGIQHIHNHFADHSGIVAMLTSKLTEIPYSLSIHGPHVFYDTLGGAMKQKVLNAQFVRCIGYFCRSQVIVYSGISDVSKLKIVHCGLNLASYPYQVPRKEVRHIFCAARLAPEKGIEFLIEALAILKKLDYRIDLRLAGDGPGQFRLQQNAVNLGLADRVTFLGTLSEQEILYQLQSSDLFVLPSLAEGIPVSLMEAMAVGIPIVATNIAGASELIDSGLSGLLVRPSDSAAIVEAVIKMISDYDFRCTASELARAKVTNEFDIELEAIKLNGYFL